MPVAPNWLEGVTTDIADPAQLKRRWRQRLVRPFVNMAHDVRLAFAAGARTMAAQFFQRHKTLAAIVPFDGQLVADGLDICGLHDFVRPPPWLDFRFLASRFVGSATTTAPA